MVSFREVLEIEVKGTKAAIKASTEAIAINGIVLKALEKELNKYPAKKIESSTMTG